MTHFRGDPRGCLGSRQCSVLQKHHMEALFGVTASSGLPSAPRSEGPEARAKHLHQNLWESPGVSGQRPSSEPPTALPSPVGAPGQPPAPLLSSWPERVLGWNCRKDGQVGVTGAPSFSMRVVRVATLLSEGVSPAAVRVGRHPDVTGRGGLKVARNVAGICSGALSSPSPGRGCQVWAYPLLLSLFGALQVIRLRHKGGCGPLAATRLLQRETMVSARLGGGGGAQGQRPPRCCPLGWGSRASDFCACVGPGETVSRARKRTLTRALLGTLWGGPWQGVLGELGRGPLRTHCVAGQQEGGDPGQGCGHQAGPARLFQRLFHV